jgi:PAS domain-containing protein
MLRPIARSEVIPMEPLLPEGSSLLALLDAFPSLAFIADADATIIEANRSARQWLGDGVGLELGLSPGAVLQCIFPRDSRGDCGTTDFCPSCFVRRSIEAVLSGKPAPRRLAHMILGAAGQPEDRWFQVSASPIELADRNLVLIVLEDATQLVELRELLPLCPGCGASRESFDLLAQARVFVNKHPDFLRADELCTECRQRPPEGIEPEDAAREPA